MLLKERDLILKGCAKFEIKKSLNFRFFLLNPTDQKKGPESRPREADARDEEKTRRTKAARDCEYCLLPN